jgi:N-acyl-D-aspartate/D-glutamate deacylase
VTAFDLLILGGTVIDGSGAPGVRADVGVVGDRIAALGDLSSAAAGNGVALVVDAADRIVCPGFVDPHGHSDASLPIDPAVVRAATKPELKAMVRHLGAALEAGAIGLSSGLTSVPAWQLGLKDRGVLRPKAFADLVVFDPDEVQVEATDLDPHRYPSGIEQVIVNGTVAIRDGRETGRHAGRLLRRAG